jgi:hypothetical protein
MATRLTNSWALNRVKSLSPVSSKLTCSAVANKMNPRVLIGIGFQIHIRSIEEGDLTRIIIETCDASSDIEEGIEQRIS